MGWYSGKSSDLNPDGPLVRAENLIRLGGGSKKVFESAQTAYSEEKYQWCLELTEALSLHSEDVDKSEIIQLQVSALRKLAASQTSANGRNWYLTKALEIQGLVDTKPSPNLRSQIILTNPMKKLFMALPVNLNYQKADEMNLLVLFHFHDTNAKFSLHIRNCIADLKDQWPEDTKSKSIDFIIEMKKEEAWKKVLARINSPLELLESEEIILKNSDDEVNQELIVPFLTFLSMFASK